MLRLLQKEKTTRKCCGIFQAKESYILESKGYVERTLESGFCPHCGSWVVELGKRDFSGRWIIETAKRKKALKLYNEHKPDIIGDILKNVKHGNRSNMGFRFGENVEVRDRKGETHIKQYAVDFNGTKELLRG